MVTGGDWLIQWLSFVRAMGKLILFRDLSWSCPGLRVERLRKRYCIDRQSFCSTRDGTVVTGNASIPYYEVTSSITLQASGSASIEQLPR